MAQAKTEWRACLTKAWCALKVTVCLPVYVRPWS